MDEIIQPRKDIRPLISGNKQSWPGMEPVSPPKKLVLCFDGTAYRFRGDEADSNVLKIFRVSLNEDRPNLVLVLIPWQ